MNRADEVIPVSSLELPSAHPPSERELAMAEQLVSSLSAPFQPERYPDEHREQVLALVERKAAGETIEAPREEAAPAQVVSLADALSASLSAARKRGGEPEAPPRHAPARGARRHAAPAAARTARRPRKSRA
jgi:DNA end-binding protein Ku